MTREPVRAVGAGPVGVAALVHVLDYCTVTQDVGRSDNNHEPHRETPGIPATWVWDGRGDGIGRRRAWFGGGKNGYKAE